MTPDTNTDLEHLHGIRRASLWTRIADRLHRKAAEESLVDEVVDAAKDGIPPKYISGQIRGGAKDVQNKG